jgi:phosphoenolpyruvate carboxykinase (ATP)
MEQHNTRVWLINTGWSGGPYGKGQRIKLGHTRAIIDAIHNGSLSQAKREQDPIFGFETVTECPEVPGPILRPRNTWNNPKDYDAYAAKLAHLFGENFKKYEGGVSAEVRSAGPVTP